MVRFKSVRMLRYVKELLSIERSEKFYKCTSKGAAFLQIMSLEKKKAGKTYVNRSVKRSFLP